jgi:sugar lactone lactonase YvrE
MTPEIIARGFAFPEGPRWHDGRLWFADQHDGLVRILEADGARAESFAVPGGPSGMGWLPDGDLLVVSMLERRLYRRHGGELTLHADFAGLHPGHTNDMVVDGQGRAYVGNIGFDFDAGGEPGPTILTLVRPDGTVEVAAEDMLCPNGVVVTGDGKRLIVAESMANRLMAFDVDGDGRLANRRIFAEIGDHVPDGICVDADDLVWVASPFAREVIRVAEGGVIVDRIATGHVQPYACMLGGADGRSLYICCAADHDRAKTVGLRSGCIAMARVAVPRGGWP